MFRLILIICLLVLFPAKLIHCNENEKKILKYIENNGQWEENILYKSSFKNGFAYVEKDGIVFVINEEKATCNHEHKSQEHSNELIKKHAFKLELINSNKEIRIKGEGKSINYYNFFIGNDLSKHRSNVHDYKKIEYKEVYNNIDWIVYSENSNFKHDFIIKKGGKIEDISIRYKGIEKIRIEKGNLILFTNIGRITELKPIAFQIINGIRKEIPVEFIINKDKTISYKAGNYDKSYDLIIDPQLIFSTYSGSYSDNWGFCATYDKKGNSYLGGITNGGSYPTTLGAFDETFNSGTWDISITKFNPNGNLLIFSTYLGSSSAEMPHSMIVNEFGELIVFGTTGGGNFPTTNNAYQNVFKGGTYIKYANSLEFGSGVDMFVAKFNSSGTMLMGSTFIGGSDNDGINFLQRFNSIPSLVSNGNDSLYSNYGDGARGEIITDDQNNVYIGSCTYSNDFPITNNAFQQNFAGIQDGVVFKLDYSLSNLLFSSYIGGSQEDAVYSIDTDNEYKLYITGGTVSHDFPTTPGAYNTSFNGGSTDGFLALVSYNGSNLIASTYFGSPNYDQSYFVRTDNFNHPHIFGQTKAVGSTLINNATYAIPNSGQFVTKFIPNLSNIVWSTVFGNGNGKKNISPSAFAVDICGRIYCSGWGSFGELSTLNFETTPDAYQANTDGHDFYFMCIDSSASNLEYATFFGELNNNDHVDGGTSRFDKFSTIYQTVCAGCGGSDDFPTTTGAYSQVNNSNNCNAAMIKFNIHNDYAIADFDYPQIGCAPTAVTFVNNGRGTSFLWDFGDGQTSTLVNPTHNYNNSGIYTVRLIAYWPGGCVESDTASVTLIVIGNTTRYLDDIHVCENNTVQIGIEPLPSDNVSFTWHPSNLVSDPNITNPFVNLNSDTQFKLIITNGVCTDTLIQNVLIDYLDINIPDTIKTCNSPITLNANYPNADSIKISKTRDYSILLNQDIYTDSAKINLTQKQYIYVLIYDGECFGEDSTFIDYIGTNVELTINHIRCAGETNGKAFADVSNGLQPYQYLWSNGINGVDNISNLSAGEYSLDVIDANGCSNYLEFEIINPDTLITKISKINNNCFDACSGMITLSPFGGFSPYSYIWNNGDNKSEIDSLCNGKYSVKIIDNNGCELDTSIQIINLNLFYEFWAKASETKVYPGKEITLMAKPLEDVYYQWQPTNVESPNNYTTRAWPQSTIIYWVFAHDDQGCKGQANVKIDVEEIICGKPNIFVANIFTPNGDGKNDILRVEGDFIENIYFAIFDRWGEKVFETKDKNQGWDGKHRGKECIQGVYYYRLEVECEKGKTYFGSGDVTLVR